jgi:hypothetical protein
MGYSQYVSYGFGTTFNNNVGKHIKTSAFNIMYSRDIDFDHVNFTHIKSLNEHQEYHNKLCINTIIFSDKDKIMLAQCGSINDFNLILMNPIIEEVSFISCRKLLGPFKNPKDMEDMMHLLTHANIVWKQKKHYIANIKNILNDVSLTDEESNNIKNNIGFYLLFTE